MAKQSLGGKMPFPSGSLGTRKKFIKYMEKHHSCLNTRAIIEYFQEKMPREVYRLIVGLGPEIESLASPQEFLMGIDNWVSSDVATRLFENAKAISKDDEIAFKIGFESAARKKLGYAQRIIMFSYKNPLRTIRKIQAINDKFNKNKSIELIKAIGNNVVIRLHWKKEIPATIDYCLFNKGVYCGVPSIWNLPAAALEETKCFFKGDEYCEYSIRWPRNYSKSVTLFNLLTPWRPLKITIAELEDKINSLNIELKKAISISGDDIISNAIIKSIEFAPEHYQAGMSILSYFNKFLNHKYPNTKIKVKIEQDGLKIRMIIETHEGDSEVIEKTLESYGLILRGEMAAEDFLDEPAHVFELKQQLRGAYFQIENQKELLRFSEKHYGKRMESLEGEVNWLRGHVGKLLIHSEKTSQAITLTVDNLLQFYVNLNDIIKTEIDSLYKKIEIGLTKADEMKVKEIFDKLQKENYGAFKQLIIFLKDSIIRGSISGASGHFLYDWIKNII